jgi:hypothetical protein
VMVSTDFIANILSTLPHLIEDPLYRIPALKNPSFWPLYAISCNPIEPASPFCCVNEVGCVDIAAAYALSLQIVIERLPPNSAMLLMNPR